MTEGMDMYLMHRIEELSRTSNDAQRAICDFILREHASISDFTIADIAEATFTSKSSVTRFAKALGYPGWREFIRDFIHEEGQEALHVADVDPNFPFAAGDSDMAIAEKLGNLSSETIAETFSQIDRGMIAAAVRSMKAARAIYVFGLSPHSYVAGLFCRKLISIGKPAQVVPYGEYGLFARSLGPEDCAFLISYSGNNPDEHPMRDIPILKANKVHLVGITSAGPNYLRQNISCVLTLASRERLYSKIANFATEESLNYLLNLLFSCFFAEDYKTNLARKLEGSQALEGARKTVLRELEG